MSRYFLFAALLAAAVGCEKTKYAPPSDDPDLYRKEQEKLDQQMKESGEQRVGKYDAKNSRDPEQAKIEQMMLDSGEERVNQTLPKKKQPPK